MAKIITFDTFCYRRHRKAMEEELAQREKELARKEEQQRKNIDDLIGYARRTQDDRPSDDFDNKPNRD